MKQRLYLLTGASGFLGGNILTQLVEKKERVRVLISLNNPAIPRMPKEAELVFGNLLDKDSLEKFFTVDEDVDVIVIHCAGIVTMDPKPNDNVYKVNVGGTKSIVENCIKHKVKKLVYISSTGAIEELPHGQVIEEVTKHNLDAVIGYYSKTKAMATNLVLEAARENDLDASVVYPSAILGPDDHRYGIITRTLKLVAAGNIPVTLDGTISSADVRDLAKGIISCSLKGKKGETYIMTGVTHTFDHLIRLIFEKMGTKKRLFKLPLWFVYPFANLGLLYSTITKTPPWFSKFTLYNLTRNNEFSSTKAEKELGFKTRPLEETIGDTLTWLKQSGRLKG